MILDGLLLMVGDVDPLTGLLIAENFTRVGANAAIGSVDTSLPIVAGQPDMGGQGQARDLGFSNVVIHLRCVDAPRSAGPATVAFEIVSADDQYLEVNPTVLASTDQFTLDKLPIQTRIPMRWPACPNGTPLRRFVGVRANIKVAPLTNTAGWLWGAAGLHGDDGDRLYRVRWKLD